MVSRTQGSSAISSRWGGQRRFALEAAALLAWCVVIAILAWPLRTHWHQWPGAWWALAAGATLLLVLIIHLAVQWAAPLRYADARLRFWRLLQTTTIGVLVALSSLHWWHLHPWANGRHALSEQYVCRLGVDASSLDDSTLRARKSNAPQANADCWPVAGSIGAQAVPRPENGDVSRAEFQWVQCSPTGPRRCVSIAWLATSQIQAGGVDSPKQAACGPDIPACRQRNNGSADNGQPKGDERNGSGLDQVVAVVATVLAVVLGVTTLIATKTATDARSEIREELGRMDAARQAERGALHAQAAMLAALLIQTHQRLVTLHFRSDAPNRRDAAALVSHLRPLTEVLYRLSGLSSGRRDVDAMRGTVRKLLAQIQLSPLRDLPAHLLDSTLRQVMRDIAALLYEHQLLLDASGRSFTGIEDEVRADLARLAHQLQDV